MASFDSHFSFKATTELTTTDESGSVALTKTVGFFRHMAIKWAQNIRIRRVHFIYTPRIGDLGEGEITAEIVDNRIDEDISDNILKKISFDVKQSIDITWEHNVQLHVNDLRIRDQDPIIMRTSISGCNMKDGFSIGHIVAMVEIQATTYIKRSLKVKEATARLSDIKQAPTEKAKKIKSNTKPVATLKYSN